MRQIPVFIELAYSFAKLDRFAHTNNRFCANSNSIASPLEYHPDFLDSCNNFVKVHNGVV